MPTTLKILMLDSDEAAATVIHEYLLKRECIHVFRLVSGKNGFIKELQNFKPDIVLTDNKGHCFNSFKALEFIKTNKLAVPLIMVTENISEKVAVDIIRFGAADFILKDRLVRLPSAIETAIKKSRVDKEIKDYKYALDQASIVCITNEKGIVTHVNENFCKVTKYSADEVLDQNLTIIESGDHDASFMNNFNKVIQQGNIWTGEIKNKAKDGSLFWVDATVVPFLDKSGKPYQYLSMYSDITKRKKGEKSLIKLKTKAINQEIQEQKSISMAIVTAQEQERNRIGQELHDNINQILAGTKMYLSIAGRKNEELKEIIKYPMELIDSSINEIRILGSKLVTPLENIDLKFMIENLRQQIMSTSNLKIYFEYKLVKKIEDEALKVNIYRILQEQMTNIIKHAKATTVNIHVSGKNGNIIIVTKDDGEGFELGSKRMGIGISNMINRIKLYNGDVEIKTELNKGCKIEIRIPYSAIKKQ